MHYGIAPAMLCRTNDGVSSAHAPPFVSEPEERRREFFRFRGDQSIISEIEPVLNVIYPFEQAYCSRSVRVRTLPGAEVGIVCAPRPGPRVHGSAVQHRELLSGRSP
jgi:hypothetical protein